MIPTEPTDAMFDNIRSALADAGINDVATAFELAEYALSETLRLMSIPDEPVDPLKPVLSYGHTWRTNADMIAALHNHGLIRDEWQVLDATYGLGKFWTEYEPPNLLGGDLDPEKSRDFPGGFDATDMLAQLTEGEIDLVVLDLPYKLNGKDQGEGHRYGVSQLYRSVAEYIELYRASMASAVQVLRAPTADNPDTGLLMFKGQNQTNAAAKVFASDIVTEHAKALGLTKIEEFFFPSHRAQPARSSCLNCGAKLMRRSGGAWGTLDRKEGADVFTCPGAISHAPDPTDNGQDLSHINYSFLYVFQKPRTSPQGALDL